MSETLDSITFRCQCGDKIEMFFNDDGGLDAIYINDKRVDVPKEETHEKNTRTERYLIPGDLPESAEIDSNKKKSWNWLKNHWQETGF